MPRIFSQMRKITIRIASMPQTTDPESETWDHPSWPFVLLQFLDVLFLPDHHQDIAVFDDEIGCGDHLNLIGENIP